MPEASLKVDHAPVPRVERSLELTMSVLNRFGCLRWLALAWIALSAAGTLAAQPYAVSLERNVAVKMRDGVALRADIYRPQAEGKFPVLLQRTPYNKAAQAPIALKAAARGYLVVLQDVRGRYASEGEWYPFKHESQDGYDTIEWAAALPGSNGKVGMFGYSYVGATQLLAALAQPPHLAGIMPGVTASNYHEGWTYQGGAFEQWFNETWTSGLAQDTLNRRIAQGTNAMDWVWKLPLASYPVLETGTAGGLAPYFLDWLAHPDDDAYWKQWSIESHHDQIAVPAYHVGAWYDIFLGGTLRNFVGLKVRGATEEARRGQRLLMVLGGHAGSGRKIGEVDFGAQALVDGDEILLRWYDFLLKGVANGMEREKPVKLFVLGKNQWREEDDWPLARAKATRFYLHSGGAANGAGSDGTLSTAAPGTELKDSFVYDPANPVPTRGGSLCCDVAHLPPGPLDQRPVEARNDVLVYTTPAFPQDFEVTGPISLEFYASSSAVDTDFTAKLVDVWPNGFAQNLTDGILRVRYRNSPEKPETLKPGEIYKLTIDLAATSNVFLAGHRLRLEVSSSNFPRFDRNLNTGEAPGQATRWVKASNAVYHDGEHPSALVLPVVPQ
jgi:putative CocE/NonD family hydrolase